MPDPKFRTTKDSALISLGKEEIVIVIDSGTPALRLTNDYGNSLSYQLTGAAFERLHAELWSFVKDSQH